VSAGPAIPGGEAGAAALTRAVTRGVRRHLRDLGMATVSELALANGRRADVVALAPDGRLTIVEVKVSRADLLGDRKWPSYGDFADAFAFAVPEGFPTELLPADAGLLVADAYGAAVVRPPVGAPLAAARRKAMLIRFATAAAARLHRLDDPEP
jgi:hypothetical protein